MEDEVAGVVQECFARDCDKPAVGTPPLFCAKHEKMIPPKATAWLRDNYSETGTQTRHWIAMISRAVAKIMMTESAEGLAKAIDGQDTREH